MKIKAKGVGGIRVTFISEQRSFRVAETIWQIVWVETKLTKTFQHNVEMLHFENVKMNCFEVSKCFGAVHCNGSQENRRLSSQNYLKAVSSYQINAVRCLGSSPSHPSCLLRECPHCSTRWCVLWFSCSWRWSTLHGRLVYHWAEQESFPHPSSLNLC